ncbi:MAG: flagellar brake protein [Burkholderiales bacterium]
MQKPLSAKPEIESLDLEKFQVYSRIEMLSVLRAIQTQRVLMTLYFNHGDEFVLTTLLAINPDYEEMVFDAGPDRQLNDRLTKSRRIVGVAFVDNVKVQFNASSAEKISYQGTDAFRLRLPDSVLRLQRRNYFRIPTPIAKPLPCSVSLPANAEQGLAEKTVDLMVLELGCGGLGVAVVPEQMRVDTGTRLEKFSLVLPNEGTVQCAIVVRHISDASKGNVRRHRLGCQFVDMSAPMAGLVQRYINKADRERRMR